MSKNMVAGPDDALGRLSELLRQLRRGPQKGGLSLNHLQALNEHRNPFEKGRAEESAEQRSRPQDQTFHFKSISEQVRLLKKYFSDLNTSYVTEIVYSLQNIELPKNAEGWIVVPKETFLGRWIPPRASTVIKTVVEIYAELLVKENIIYQDRAKGFLDPGADSLSLVQELLKLQPRGDVVIFPVQLGLSSRGQPLYQFKEEKKQNEFLLNLRVLFSFFLTHPDYLLDIAPYAIQIGCGGQEVGDNQYTAWVKDERLDKSKITYFPISGEGNSYVGWASGFVPGRPENEPEYPPYSPK